MAAITPASRSCRPENQHPGGQRRYPRELRPDSQQYDLIAQALNDHLTDVGRDQPIPYSSSR